MAGKNIIEVNDSSFDQEVVKSELPVLVDFWAPWCGPCRAIAPVIDELATEFDGKLKVAKCNVDDNPKTPGNFGIRAIPTLIIFKGGKVERTDHRCGIQVADHPPLSIRFSASEKALAYPLLLCSLHPQIVHRHPTVPPRCREALTPPPIVTLYSPCGRVRRPLPAFSSAMPLELRPTVSGPAANRWALQEMAGCRQTGAKPFSGGVAECRL